MALGSIGQLSEALQANHETLAICEAIGMSDTIDAQVVSANTGVLEMRQGHLRDAEVLLRRSTERERALAGDSAAAASALAYYGRLLALTNRVAPALSVLREASAMATKYAGADSPVAMQAQLFTGEAYLAAGDVAQGGALLQKTSESAKGRFGPANLLTLRTQTALAELALAEGRPADARRLLTDSIAGMRKMGATGEPNLAQALELLGDTEVRLDALPEAERALREAVRLREKLPADLWELAEARAHLGEALLRGGSPEGAPLLRQAANDLEAQLGASHPQTVRARQALSAG